jgi:hypothetical protein
MAQSQRRFPHRLVETAAKVGRHSGGSTPPAGNLFVSTRSASSRPSRIIRRTVSGETPNVLAAWATVTHCPLSPDSLIAPAG